MAVQTAVQLRRYHNILLLPKNILHCDCRDIFNITLSKHAPLRRKSRKEKKLNSKPWITKGILISSKTKNKLYIANLKGSANDVQLYKTYRNKLTHVKEQAKRKYYQGLVLASKHNMKFLWKTINDIAKYKKKQLVS